MRSDEWNAVKERIEYSGKYTKKELKVFEKFFLKGQEPDWSQVGYDPIPLLFRLWFSEEKTPAAWNDIVAKVFAYHPWQVKASLDQTVKLIREELSSDQYSGKDGAPAGFLGGLEKQIFDFLVGTSTGDYLKYDGKKVYQEVVFNVSYYITLAYWLGKGDYANPYNFCHLTYEFWYASLSDETAARIKERDWVEAVMEYFELVAKIFNANDESDQERLAYSRVIYEIMESRPLPSDIHTWWVKAKVTAAA